jgi:two-component system, LuxR family, sensor kinase FixL
MPYWAASLTAILRTSLDAVIIVDREGRVRGWNHHAETVFGWTEAEALRRCVDELLVPERHRDSFRSRLRLVADGGETHLIGRRFELTGMHKDGSDVPIELGVLGSSGAGEPLLIAFARDLTEQKRAQAELQARNAELEEAQAQLRESEELYRNTVELGSLIPWTADVDGRIMSVGDLWLSWVGASREEALDHGWTRFVHPDDAARTNRRWAASLSTGNRYEAEFRLRMADGGYRWCLARATKRDGAEPGSPAWYGTLEDVHERRTAADAFQQAQAELAHVSRLTAMGAMGAAIAHDLNQPLTAIAHYVRGCRRLLSRVNAPETAAIAEALADADRSVVRAGDIVRRVREFVTRGSVDFRREQLGPLVKEACKFALVDAAARGIGYRLELETDCPVIADRVQLQQVIVNLVRNAVAAVDGQLKREIVIRTAKGPDGFCEVSVRDTGPGFARDAAARMFEPFYTTRQGGMGIGLSISRMLVEAHGGTIRNASVPGGETVISFTIPEAAVTATTGQVPAAAE